MVEMELIELLRQLEMMIEEAPAKAFSHKIVVDREEILSLIKEIKSVIPEEVKQASWINTERVKIISDAKKEAEEIVLQGEKEVERLNKELARVNGMLANPNFVSKAPEKKINEEKEKQAKYQEMMKQVQSQLENLKK